MGNHRGDHQPVARGHEDLKTVGGFHSIHGCVILERKGIEETALYAENVDRDAAGTVLKWLVTDRTRACWKSSNGFENRPAPHLAPMVSPGECASWHNRSEQHLKGDRTAPEKVGFRWMPRLNQVLC